MKTETAKWFAITATIILAFSGCGPNRRIIESGQENPPIERPNANIERAPRSFESDIEAMRTADFSHIYVLRRKDGGELDADDKRFLSANIPADANRREISDVGRALLIGTNFPIPDNMLETLKERFDFTDHSKPGNRQPNTNGTR